LVKRSFILRADHADDDAAKRRHIGKPDSVALDCLAKKERAGNVVDYLRVDFLPAGGRPFVGLQRSVDPSPV
jgi:hypothetical protein